MKPYLILFALLAQLFLVMSQPAPNDANPSRVNALRSINTKANRRIYMAAKNKRSKSTGIFLCYPCCIWRAALTLLSFLLFVVSLSFL
ncbi:hypothetical protein BY458DRAFT_506020 [Sporodiniella umbellata]|nr:hypothetical protein BY458DRAFT_506020 [Sporodiniella umbellata]